MLRTALLVTVLTACGAEPGGPERPQDPHPSAQRTDSAGVRVVASSAPLWQPGEGWRLAAEPDLVVGSVEGRDGDDFGRVRTLVALSDGRIVVGDDGAHRLRMFSAEGSPVGTVGREGDGPGEFGGIRMIRRFGGDSLAVFDWSNARLTWVSPELDVVRTEPVRTRVQGITMPHVKVITASGTPVLTGARPPWLEEAVEHYGQPQHLLVREQDEYFDREIGVSPGKGFLDVHYAALGDEVLVVHGGEFDVRVYDLEGRLRRRIRRAHDAPEIPDEFFEASVDQLGNPEPVTLTGVGADGIEHRIRTQMVERDPADYPEALPAADDLLVDHADHIWVRHGAWPEDVARTWSIFRPDGQWLGEVTTPIGLTVHDITESHLYGVRTDELDVQYVVRYPLLGRR